jgi:hypothetical protein
MEENLEASLSSMIGLFPPRTCCLPGLTLSDPVLQSPDREVPPKTPSPGFDTPSAQPKKVRGIIPGSAADFRRREANRLAAERSRSRQHEKVVGLEVSAQTLGEENVRLKEQIAKLETDGDITGEEHGQHEAVPAAPVAEDSQQDAQQAQDSHSRTILAALMSGVTEAFPGETGDVETDEASWMQGVENLFKEAESSGRLGELAAAAAGRGDGSAAAQESSSKETTAQKRTDSQIGVAEPAVLPRIGYNSTMAAAATASAVAVAINAEMEKQLRDDLARTKAAVARIEREMARLRGEPASEEVDDDTETPSTLPGNILSTDADVLREQSAEMERSIGLLEAELPIRREMVMHIRDAKVEDETKLAGEVSDLHGESGGETEKVKIDAILKSMGGFVGSMLGGPPGGLPGEVSPTNRIDHRL